MSLTNLKCICSCWRYSYHADTAHFRNVIRTIMWGVCVGFKLYRWGDSTGVLRPLYLNSVRASPKHTPIQHSCLFMVDKMRILLGRCFKHWADRGLRHCARAREPHLFNQGPVSRLFNHSVNLLFTALWWSFNNRLSKKYTYSMDHVPVNSPVSQWLLNNAL